MKEQKENTGSRTIVLEKKVVAHHLSDDSELIPTEVQMNIVHNGSQLLAQPPATGYTVDDEAIINNYAIQPDMSLAEYPSAKQQRRSKMVRRYNHPALHEEPRYQPTQILLIKEKESLYAWIESTGRFKSYESDGLHDLEVSEELEDIMETSTYDLEKEEEAEELYL